MEGHGVLKCPKDDVSRIDKEDIIGMRVSEFGAEVMVGDRKKCGGKYPDFVIDKATLDEILVFYVKG